MSPRLRALLALLCAVISVVALFQLAAAAWPVMWQENGVPVCTVPGWQTKPLAVLDGQGGAIIVWEDWHSGDSDLFAQRLAPDGSRLWISGGVTVNAGFGYQYYAGVAPDTEGGVLVAWFDYVASDTNVRAQRLDGQGLTLWATDGVTVYEGWRQLFEVETVQDGDGGTIVGWMSYDMMTENTEIRAQRVSSGGILIWPEEAVSVCGPDKHPYDLKMATDGAGGAIMVWQGNGVNKSEILAQRLNAAGELLWNTGGITVSKESEWGNSKPSIASNGDGGAIIAWKSYVSIDEPNIYAQRIGPGGEDLWGADPITVCAASGHQNYPAICTDGDGGAVVTWQDYRNGYEATGWDIYAQRILSDGITAWYSGGVTVCSVVEQQKRPQILPFGRGGATVIWEDTRNDPPPDIYAQQIDGEGHLVWHPDGVPICIAENYQWQPSAVPSGGGAIVAWGDERSGGGETDIYAQRIAHFSWLAHLPQVMHD